jgi:hypothetical protein
MLPVVVNSAGEKTSFSQDRLVGHLVRRGVPPAMAMSQSDSVLQVVAGMRAGTVTTDQLRRVVDDVSDPGASLAGVIGSYAGTGTSADTPGGPLADGRIRLAIQCALDCQRLFEAYGQEPPPDLSSYQPELARWLLTEAGYPTGLQLAVVTADETLFAGRPYALMREMLAGVGVQLTQQLVAWPEWIQRATAGVQAGSTLYHVAAGVFLAELAVQGMSLDLEMISPLLKDMVRLISGVGAAAIRTMVISWPPIPIWLADVTAGVVLSPPSSPPRSRRRMRVFMYPRNKLEKIFAGATAWWPGLMTASRTNYSGSIDDLCTNTLDDASNDGACFSVLEIMSHGGNDSIRIGSDTIGPGDFDASGQPSTPKAQKLLDSLKRAMCPDGELIFTACGQTTGSTLRQISKYLNQNVTVSGNTGTGQPPLLPGGLNDSPDEHYQNGNPTSP